MTQARPPFSRWLSRTDPAATALVLPCGESLSYADLAGRSGHAGLQVLTGDATTLALGCVDSALGGGTALLLPPGQPADKLTALVELARQAADPRLALIVATSGSTGEPKGVRLSWRAVAAAARLARHGLDFRRGDAWLGCLPLSFIGGAMILYRALRAGATAVVHDGFSVDAVARDFSTRRITHISLVPAMLAQLVDAAVPPAPTLRCALIGGAALSPSLAERARAAGWPLRISYGMTETCATALVDGHPLPGVRVRIDANGVLAIATPARMAGYLGQANAGAWFATSDLAAIEPDGRVRILGRADDMLISGGINVHPLEVESRLAACPGVREAGVTGLADPVWGDIIACVYAGEAPEPVVDQWCRAAMTKARRPRRFLRVDRLPRLASGKLDRHALPRLWS
jgi:O-succinylbenzoic acid--CoA ligase